MSDTIAIDTRLEMGRVIRLTFGVIGRNAAAIAVFSLVPSLFGAVLDGFIDQGLPRLSAPWAAGLVTTLLSLVVNGIAATFLTQVAVNDLDNRDTRLGPVLRAALRVVFPVIVLNLAVGIGVGLASLLLLFPGMMLLTRWFVAIPVRVAEPVGMTEALRRSAELTRGNRWRIFGLLVVYGLLFTLVSFLVLGLSGGLGGTVRSQGALDPVVFAAKVVTTGITAAIGSVGIAMIYAELRRVRQGGLPNQLAAVFE